MKKPQWIFEDDLKWSKLKLAIIKENFEYRQFFRQFLGWVRQKEPRFGTVPDFKKFGIVGFDPFPGYAEYLNFKDLCDPTKDINSFPKEVVESILPRLFYQNAVTSVHVKGQPETIVFEGYRLQFLENIVKEGLNPWERLYKIDLRKKKSQIMEELERYLDGAYSKQELSNDKDDYYSWEQDKSRYRKEAWDALTVWELRRQKRPFKAISRELDISEDTAKKRFYRAFELTQSMRYEPESFRRDNIQKSELKKSCDVCPLRDSCTTLCPDVLAFLEQGQGKQTEKLFNNPDYIDSLLFNETL